MMLLSRFAPEITRRNPSHAPNDYIHLFKRARVEQFTGLWPDNDSYCWVQIRNAGNVLIVDSFVLVVRGLETDSRGKSYGRLKFLPRHQRVPEPSEKSRGEITRKFTWA